MLLLVVVAAPVVWFASLRVSYYERADLQDAVAYGRDIARVVEGQQGRALPPGFLEEVEQRGRLGLKLTGRLDSNTGVITVMMPDDRGSVVLTPQGKPGSVGTTWKCALFGSKAERLSPDCKVN